MLNLHITLKRYSVLIKAEIIYKVSIAFYYQNLKIIHMSNNQIEWRNKATWEKKQKRSDWKVSGLMY